MSPIPPVRLKDIAQAAGVSVSAVSLALRDSPKVSAKRRLKIQKIAKKMGHTLDPRMRELMRHLRKPRSTRGTTQVAILIPEIKPTELDQNPRIKLLLNGITNFAQSVGFEIEPLFLSSLSGGSKGARARLDALGIKGVLVLPFPSGVAQLDFDFSGLCVATAGYSIVEPMLHRACPDYLKMMDGMIAMCVSGGYKRIGLVMTKTGGIGFKLFSSSFLYYQSKIPRAKRVPMLDSPIRKSWHEKGATEESIRDWFNSYNPDVIIGTAKLLKTIDRLGLRVPNDIGFVSIDLSEDPTEAAGANHCFEMVGEEAFKLMLTSLNLNLTGIPEHPRVVLVDSHQQPGVTLKPQA